MLTHTQEGIKKGKGRKKLKMKEKRTENIVLGRVTQKIASEAEVWSQEVRWGMLSAPPEGEWEDQDWGELEAQPQHTASIPAPWLLFDMLTALALEAPWHRQGNVSWPAHLIYLVVSNLFSGGCPLVCDRRSSHFISTCTGPALISISLSQYSSLLQSGSKPTS